MHLFDGVARKNLSRVASMGVAREDVENKLLTKARVVENRIWECSPSQSFRESLVKHILVNSRHNPLNQNPPFSDKAGQNPLGQYPIGHNPYYYHWVILGLDSVCHVIDFCWRHCYVILVHWLQTGTDLCAWAGRPAGRADPRLESRLSQTDRAEKSIQGYIQSSKFQILKLAR